MAMLEPTTTAAIVRGLIDFAASKGADREALAERAGIDLQELQDHDKRIPVANYVALMRASKELCNDPALALHFGESVACWEMSVVGLICATCESMMEGFTQLNRYARLASDVDIVGSDRFRLAQADGGVLVIDMRKNPNDFPETTESTFARFAGNARRQFDVSLAKALYVTHRDPGYRAEYERIFSAPVFFESDKNAMLIDEAWMTRKLSLMPRYAFGVLNAHAEALLKKLDYSKSTRGRVENLLMPILHTGQASVEGIAAKMGMSRWTLTRRLRTEGSTFERVLDELRCKMALHYLEGKKVSVNEAAYLVGFSDPAVFSRAFKRWTGKCPRDAVGVN